MISRADRITILAMAGRLSEDEKVEVIRLIWDELEYDSQVEVQGWEPEEEEEEEEDEEEEE